MKIKSKKLRDSAKGQECTLNIPGVCNYDPSTTVLCHFPDESNGMGTKSTDISSGFGCHDCHAAIDGRLWHRFEPGDKDFYMRRSQTRTLAKWIDMGLVKL